MVFRHTWTTGKHRNRSSLSSFLITSTISVAWLDGVAVARDVDSHSEDHGKHFLPPLSAGLIVACQTGDPMYVENLLHRKIIPTCSSTGEG